MDARRVIAATCRRGAFAALALLVAPAAAFGGEDTPPPVAIVLLDALRPDHLGAYGYTARATSPSFDALAASSVLFERAYAPAPYTAASVATLLTGLPPESHTLTHLDRRLPTGLHTLPQALRAAGYRSLVASRSGILSGFGLQDGFDVAVVDPALAGDMKRFRRTWKQRADELTSGGAPWLVYLHLFPPHAPYEPPQGFPLPFALPRVEGVSGRVPFLGALDRGEATLTPEGLDALRARYDANLRYGDHLLGDAVGFLAERGLIERGWLIVMSDHGEAFGEHGRYEHNSTVYEEMIRVPLLIRPPGGIAGGRRVTTPVGIVDLLPTIARWAGVEVPAGLAGVALDPTAADPVGVRARPLTSRATGGAPRFALIQGSEKLIVPLAGDGPRELYDLASDPRERADLVAREPQRAAALDALVTQELARQRAEAVAPQPLEALDPAVEEGLRALGYIE